MARGAGMCCLCLSDRPDCCSPLWPPEGAFLCRLQPACVGRHPTLFCLLVMWRLQGRRSWLYRHNCQIVSVLKHAFPLSPVMSSMWLLGRCLSKLFHDVDINDKITARQKSTQMSEQQQFTVADVGVDLCSAALRARLTFIF